MSLARITELTHRAARFLPLLVLLVPIALGGCATAQKGHVGDEVPTDTETGTVRLEKLATPEETGAWEAGEDRVGWESEAYRLQPGDEVEIRVLYNSDLLTVTKVLPDGSLSVPVIGQMQAAGKTPTQVADVIAEGLSEYIVKPRVSVVMRKIAGNYVFVLGEVRSPGAHEISGPLTVTQAIAKAGGALPNGKLSSVVVVRRTSPGTVAGMRVNVAKVLGGKRSATDKVVRAYDIIYVPTTLIGKIDFFLEQFFSRTVSPWVWYVWAKTAIEWDETDVQPISVPK